MTTEKTLHEEAVLRLRALDKRLPGAGMDIIRLAQHLASDLERQKTFTPALYIVSYLEIVLEINAGRKIDGRKFFEDAASRWRTWLRKITTDIFPADYAQQVMQLVQMSGVKTG
jgi:hypothetical protein